MSSWKGVPVGGWNGTDVNTGLSFEDLSKLDSIMPRFQDVTIAGALSLSAESQVLPKLSTPEVNSIRFVTNDTTPGFGTIQEAVDDLGSNSGLVIIRSTYVGTEPTSVPNNVTILDLRTVAAVSGTSSEAKIVLYSGNTTPLNDIGGLFGSFPRRGLLLVQDEIADSGAGSSGVTESGEDAIEAAIRTLDPHKDVVAVYGQAIMDVAADGGGVWGANFQAIGGGGLDTKLSGLELDTSSQLFLPVNISAISRTSNVVTVDTAAAHGLSVSDTIYVGGTTGTTDFKGTFQVAGVTDSDTFTYNQTAADDTGTGGDVRKMGLGTESKSGLLINAFNNEISEAILIGGGDLTRGIFRNGLNFVAKSMNPFSGALIGAQPAPYNNGIDWSQATFNGEAIILGNGHNIQLQGTGSNHAGIKTDSADVLVLNGGADATTSVSLRNQAGTEAFRITGAATPKASVNNGIDPNGGGFKHARITTGSISASSSAAVTVTWSTAFADANYTVHASVVEADTDTATLQVDHIESVSASAVVVRVENEDGGSAKTGTLHVIAVHD